MSGMERLLDQLSIYLSDEQPHTIGIYGHGASGKSVFATKLLSRLGESQVNILETDPYVIAEDYRKLLCLSAFPEQKVTACLPSVHELNSLKRDILSLKSGLDIMTIETTWLPAQRLSATKPILIVEGMSVAFLPKSLFDLSICFYTDAETELSRRLKCDSTVRGREIKWIKKAHEARQRQYEEYYQSYQNEADIIVNQSGNDFKIEKCTDILK